MRIARVINKLWEVCQEFSATVSLIFYSTEYYKESLIFVLFYFTIYTSNFVFVPNHVFGLAYS